MNTNDCTRIHVRLGMHACTCTIFIATCLCTRYFYVGERVGISAGKVRLNNSQMQLKSQSAQNSTCNEMKSPTLWNLFGEKSACRIELATATLSLLTHTYEDCRLSRNYFAYKRKKKFNKSRLFLMLDPCLLDTLASYYPITLTRLKNIIFGGLQSKSPSRR